MQGKHKDSVKCTCVTAMAPAPVRPTSLKLTKVNFLTGTIILFQLKYLIFKIKKIDSLSFKLKKNYNVQTTKPDYAKSKINMVTVYFNAPS